MTVENVGTYQIEIRKDTAVKNLYYYTVTVGLEQTGGQALGYGQAMAMANDRAYELLERAGLVQ
jgi:phenylalanine-4-hydroxylase